MMLNELNALPTGLLELQAAQLKDALGGPTLIHLSGQLEPPLFIAVLLHGNEPVGWDAVRRLLRRYLPGQGAHPLPRSVSLFIGNVLAAEKGVRRLEGQADYNRVWPGCEENGSAEQKMMRQVVAIMEDRGVFASVDLHNNTGINPHYACINVIDSRFLHLASMFSHTVVYFTQPKGVQSRALADHCPAVTLECGKVGQARGVTHAEEYLETVLHLRKHPVTPLSNRDIQLLHTVATVKVDPSFSIGFQGGGMDIEFFQDLDHLNFHELPRGTIFGQVKPGCGLGLSVTDEQGGDVTGHYFTLDGENVTLDRPVIPSMLTSDREVVRQDCLCYLMEHYDDHI